MAKKIYINDNWFYKPNCEIKTINTENWSKVELPHTNIETPYNYFSEDIYQFISCYYRKIAYNSAWNDKKIFLNFEAVAHIAEIYVNGKFVFKHIGGYTAFSVDVTDYLSKTAENIIVVQVDSRESNNIPPFGKVIDYMTYGGIYREAYLEVKNVTFLQDVFIKTKTLNSIDLEFNIENYISNLNIDVYIKEKNNVEWSFLQNIELNGAVQNLKFDIKDTKVWSTETPNLYELKIILKNEDVILDENITMFGFRTCEFKSDGFYLNGVKTKIIGLNRHQSYPYVGYAMPSRVQQLDADILKNELGLNAVRTSHYPQSQHFINRCDEIGLLVFTEITGWQHIGDNEWKNVAIETAREMVMQYRNHPSIIIWGARINESADDDEFYTKTNQVIHSLDDTRQTGGVRCIKHSNLLEDVYTYNDFSHTGNNAGAEPKKAVTKNTDKPYLITEYMGHMFPTKTVDNEARRLEHALRHANVLQSINEIDDISGGFGWCMFDYNTHKDFGSGDRICHHGVMSMFRIPKLAANVYLSQNSKSPVLEISSTMNIGEYPGGYIEKVVAFTNAEQIKLYKNNEYVKTFYPNTKDYPNLTYPPFVIDDFIGELLVTKENMSESNSKIIKEVLNALVKYGQFNLPLKYKLKMAKVMLFEKLTLEDGTRLYYDYVGDWGGDVTTYRFDAIRNNQVIKSVTKTTSNTPTIKAEVDTTTLNITNTYDVATVRIKIADDNGEILPYYNDIVTFETTGDIEIIGPNQVSAIAGSCGTYIKTTGSSGVGCLTIKTQLSEPVIINFSIKKDCDLSD